MHHELNASAGSGNILEVKNNQVNKFSVDYAGNVTSVGGAIKDTDGLSRIVFAPAKTIVDGAATALFSVPVAALASIGGSFTFHVFATDATDMQAISGIGTYSAVNKAGTVTAAIDYETTNEAKSVSAGTLTLAFTAAEDSADVVSFKLTPTGSLTETSYNVTFTLFPHKGAVTIL